MQVEAAEGQEALVKMQALQLQIIPAGMVDLELLPQLQGLRLATLVGAVVERVPH
jgi:hypothetical protein